MPALPLLNPPLSDGTVTLRPWHRQDAAVLTALCQDATIVRWTNVPAGYIEQMAHARIAQAEAERRAGRALILAVVDAQTDEVLGACDLRLPADDRTRAEVGYMLGVHARGRGVMTRAVKRSHVGRSSNLASSASRYLLILRIVHLSGSPSVPGFSEMESCGATARRKGAARIGLRSP